MSQTINGKHLANRPMTRSPRPRPRRPRRTGLLLGALAAVVAAIIAIPALVALAAPKLTMDVVPAEGQKGIEVNGAMAYADDATYTVTITAPSGITLNTTGATTVSGTADDSTVAWADNSSWSQNGNDDQTHSYTRNVTVTGGTLNQIVVNASFLNSDGSTDTEELRSDKRITVDKNAPVVSIKMSQVSIGNDDTTDYFGEAGLKATVTVEDATFDSKNSTINGTGSISEWTHQGGSDVWTATYTVGEHESTFTVFAKDQVGKETSNPYGTNCTDSKDTALTRTAFKVDTTKPEVSITFADADGNKGTYFQSGTITGTVTVSDRYLGSVAITCDGNDDMTNWTKGADTTGADGSTVWTYTRDFSVEDAYTIGVTATKTFDPQGVFVKGEASETLRIDSTNPVASVSYNLKSAADNYYDTQENNLVATITVKELLSFDPSKIIVTTNDGQPADVSWSGTTGTVTFDKDGSYTLEVSGADAAGNKLEIANDSPVKIPSEIVTDGTNPIIKVTYVNDEGQIVVPNDHGYFNCSVTPTISITEANFDENGTTVRLDGDIVENLKWSSQDGASNVHVASLGEISSEEKHTIEISTTDKAKHTETQNEQFTIDMTPLTFQVDWGASDPEVGDVVTDDSDTKTSYYAGARTATITPLDDDFDVEDITISTGSEGVQAKWDEGAGSWAVQFPSDGAYRLKVSGEDLADNPAVTYDSQPFVIDTEKPELEVTFADTPADTDEENHISYYAAERVATIKVTEQNFNEDRVNIDLSDGADVTYGNWTDEGNNVHTRTVTLHEPKTDVEDYQLKVSATDRANNPAESDYDSGTFVVDTTDPEVSIQLNKAQVQEVGGVDYFAEAPTATVTVKDANFKSADSRIETSGTWDDTWTEGDTDNGITTWTTTVSFAEGTNQSLSVTAADWAAHKTETAYGTSTTDSEGKELTQSTFTVDLTAPEVTSASVDRNPVNNYGDNYYFNAATTLTVNVSDNIGLDSLTMTDADDGTYVLGNQIEAGAKTGTVTIGFADGHDFDRAVTVRTTDLAHNYRYWSIAPDGTVSAVNYADPSNEPVFDGTYPESMLQDTVAPVVSLSGVEAGAYYNSPQSVLLSVDELNMPILRTYEPDQVVLTVTQVAGNASGATSTWTRPLSQLAGTGGINYQLTEPFSADGHYTVSAQVTDPARNQDSAQIGEFTIDQTAPTVEVSFDNNDVLNGKYYKAGRTATITVTEHNFDPSLVSIDTNGAVGSWSNNGDTHTIQVSFSTDGVYNLSVSGTDRAGNAMAPYQADEFVVDLTAPTVTISGVEDSTAYKGVVEPTISFADEANFDPNGTTYTLTGTKNGAVTYDASTSAEAQGSTVSYADFAREADVDDIYTLTAHLSDLAGNEADATVTFSVNRFGSTFRVVDAGSYEENDGYLTERRDVVIEEINVSGVASESHDVTVTEGTTVSDLTLNDTAQDTGYTIESGTSTDADSNGWSVYTYRVAAGNFVNDGRYHVAVESVDRADNTNTSSSYYDRSSGEVAAAEVDFILDTTDPVITNLNVQSGQTYDSSAYQGSFTVVENIGLRDVEVLVDGEKVEATDDGYGNYTFEVNAASFTPRDLQITATDLAGRRGTADAEGFHVTTDILELHLPWVIAGAIVVVAAAAGAFYVLVYKPRKDQDQGSNTDAAA